METVRHSEQTLGRALMSKNPALVSQYEKLNAGEQRLMNEAFQPNRDLFGPITLHSKSDWITSHPEAPKTLNSFSAILTERHPLRRNAVFTYSALEL